MDNETTAYMHCEDGQRWIRIIPPNGMEYDEPVTGWSYIMGGMSLRHSFYRHTDGREYRAVYV